MGILSSLQNLVSSKVSESTRAKVYSASNTALTVLTSPIASIKNFAKAKQETETKSAAKLVAEGVENTLLVVAPFTSAGKSLLVKAAAKSVSSVKAATTTFLAAAGLTGAVATKTGRSILTSLPTPSDIFSSVAGSTKKTLEFIGGENKDIPTEKDWYAVARSLGLGAGIAILAAGGIYMGYKLFGDKLKKVEEETIPNNTTPQTPETPKQIQPIKDTIPEVIPTNTATPTLPETIAVKPTSLTKKRRHKTTKQPLNIIQKTNIMINNTNSGTKFKTKKYLNANVL